MQKKRGESRKKAKNPDAVGVPYDRGSDPMAAIAARCLQPAVQNAVTIRRYTKGAFGNGPDTDSLIAELQKQLEAANRGDLSRPEATLVAQAHTLDVIFGGLARRAADEHSFPDFQAFLQLALKAQAQCRATIQTLGELKAPRQAQFVRQQNLALNQQVNNDSSNEPRARGAALKHTNELLKEHPIERLECGETSSPGAADTPVATLGKINRS
jgi:hypothetical protein